MESVSSSGEPSCNFFGDGQQDEENSGDALVPPSSDDEELLAAAANPARVEIAQLSSLIALGDRFLHQVKESGFLAAALLLGQTGDGKTTLGASLSGDQLTAHKNPYGSIYLTDSNGKIGEPDIQSKTFLPDIFRIPGNSDYCVIDLPGFNENRGAWKDFAASVYNKRAVGSFPQLKFLFVVTFSKVQMGNKTGFDELAGYAVQFIRNVKKYEESIGLVVTGVKTEGDDDLPDGLILGEIWAFLQKYKSNLQQLPPGAAANKIAFVDSLLHRDALGTPTKIAISRKPKTVGLLKDGEGEEEGVRRDPTLEATRQAVTELLDTLKYAEEVDLKDFDFARKSETTCEINKLVELINGGIVNQVDRVMGFFQDKWISTAKTSSRGGGGGGGLKLKDVHAQLLAGWEEVDLLLRNCEWSVEYPTQLESLVIAAFDKAGGWGVPPGFSCKMAEGSRLIKFLEGSTSHPRLRQTEAWIGPVAAAEQTLRGYSIWYDYVWKLEKTLISYDYHRNKGIITTSTSLEHRFCWIEDYKYKRAALTPALNVREGHVLDKLCELAVKGVLVEVVERNGGELLLLVITGSFIRFSEVVRILHEYPMEHGERQVEQVWVFGEHTLFLDADLTSPGLLLFIAVPNVEVVVSDQVTLNVSGLVGPEHPSGKAEDGAQPGGNGENGLAGIAGDPGGRIVVITSMLRNASRLTLSARGGAGSRGQDGGDGAAGENGRDATREDCLACPIEENDQLFWGFRGTHVQVIQIHKGHNGTDGGSGGNGGRGGVGGKPGSVRVVCFFRPCEMEGCTVLEEAGDDGADGDGGPGGEGGLHGAGYRIERFEFRKGLKWIHARHKADERPANESEPTRKGADGLQGVIPSIPNVNESAQISLEDGLGFYLDTFSDEESLDETREFVGMARELLEEGRRAE